MKISFLFFLFFAVACSSLKNGEQEIIMNWSKENSKVIIYKTNKDYYYNVPITLSEDRQTITSYPHPKDLKLDDDLLRLPINLENGYLLDIKGINENTAFINMTYDKYSQLESSPSIEEMKKLVIDDNPFLEIYDCGYRNEYKDIIVELNDKIKNNKLSEFRKIK